MLDIRNIFTAVSFSFLIADSANAQDPEFIQTLDTYTIHAGSVAIDSPLPTYANPISTLTFSPQIDLQSRSFPEAQGDISIRGGTFENTGIDLGGLAIFDPQTGHYLSELPIDPNMIGRPSVHTGYENQLNGFNANVGSIQYNWNNISMRSNQLIMSVGENNLNTQSFYSALPFGVATSNTAIDIGIARSESNGTIEFGDHQFSRYAARFQLRSDTTNLNFFAGYQDKFFGWPNMYTPYNVQETEDIQTLLLVANANIQWSSLDRVTLSGYYRINWDDYEFDRDRPGLYNPYMHKTKIGGIHASWEHETYANNRYGLSGHLYLDSIDSTSLNHSFQSRTYSQLKAYCHNSLSDQMEIDISASVFGTNRDGTSIDAAARLSRDLGPALNTGFSHIYAEYSSSSQVSGYTAIGSATTGLFAGNPNLGIARSHNFEFGYLWQTETSMLQVSTFYRLDRDLTDWTYSYNSQNARTANPVDIDTLGLELMASHKWNHTLVSVGYTALEKTKDYGNQTVDASFYALNFAKHRLTLALVQKLNSRLELRLDSEYRIQEKNLLRKSDDEAVLTYLSLVLHPLASKNWDIRLSIDNLFDSDFEEIPAVPASRRQFAIQSILEW